MVPADMPAPAFAMFAHHIGLAVPPLPAPISSSPSAPPPTFPPTTSSGNSKALGNNKSDNNNNAQTQNALIATSVLFVISFTALVGVVGRQVYLQRLSSTGIQKQQLESTSSNPVIMMSDNIPPSSRGRGSGETRL